MPGDGDTACVRAGRQPDLATVAAIVPAGVRQALRCPTHGRATKPRRGHSPRKLVVLAPVACDWRAPPAPSPSTCHARQQPSTTADGAFMRVGLRRFSKWRVIV